MYFFRESKMTITVSTVYELFLNNNKLFVKKKKEKNSLWKLIFDEISRELAQQLYLYYLKKRFAAKPVGTAIMPIATPFIQLKGII